MKRVAFDAQAEGGIASTVRRPGGADCRAARRWHVRKVLIGQHLQLASQFQLYAITTLTYDIRPVL